MTAIITKSEMVLNKPRLFNIENDNDEIVAVLMHPRCYVDMCVGGVETLCYECIRRVVDVTELTR